jgi:hypothetical protein
MRITSHLIGNPDQKALKWKCSDGFLIISKELL